MQKIADSLLHSLPHLAKKTDQAVIIRSVQFLYWATIPRSYMLF